MLVVAPSGGDGDAEHQHDVPFVVRFIGRGVACGHRSSQTWKGHLGIFGLLPAWIPEFFLNPVDEMGTTWIRLVSRSVPCVQWIFVVPISNTSLLICHMLTNFPSKLQWKLEKSAAFSRNACVDSRQWQTITIPSIIICKAKHCALWRSSTLKCSAGHFDPRLSLGAMASLPRRSCCFRCISGTSCMRVWMPLSPSGDEMWWDFSG